MTTLPDPLIDNAKAAEIIRGHWILRTNYRAAAFFLGHAHLPVKSAQPPGRMHYCLWQHPVLQDEGITRCGSPDQWYELLERVDRDFLLQQAQLNNHEAPA